MLQVNCGYARVAIVELSGAYKGRQRSIIDRKELSKKFLDVFSFDGFQKKASRVLAQ